MNEKHSREVIIIGGGPAGYTAALYTARANLEPLVFEGFQWGGQLQNTTDVENYPGYPEGIMGPEMMAQFRAQAERFGTRFVTDDVDRVELSDGGVQKVYLGDEEHLAKTVILAMGAEPRRLGVPGEMELGGLVRPSAQRDDRLVLQQDDRVGDSRLGHCGRERALERKGLAVGRRAVELEQICALHGASVATAAHRDPGPPSVDAEREQDHYEREQADGACGHPGACQLPDRAPVSRGRADPARPSCRRGRSRSRATPARPVACCG